MQDKSRFLPDSGFWKDRKVLVTGGRGFLGRQLVERLAHYGADVAAPTKDEFNFTSQELAMKCLAGHRPEIVIHSAAYYGGLGITLAEPGRIYYENLVMGANLMEASRVHGVKKFVSIGTACSYPGHLENRLAESELWSGPLHDSVVAYGSAKKMLAIQGLAYQKQYGFRSIHLIPSNLYGPHDCYDDYRSHAVGALVRKFCEAQAWGDEVKLWGTGAAIREFLFVEDCADGIVLAAEKYGEITPLNIGTGVGTSVRELADTISRTVEFRGRVVWDRTRPDGQPVKFLDISKMRKALGWSPRTRLAEGIAKTVAWYRANHETARKAA